MSDQLSTILRSIAREEALRSSGTDPDPLLVERTVSFIGASPDLLADERIRGYILARSDTLYYHIATKLLDLIIPLHERGFEEEALLCFRKLARIDDPGIWDPEGKYLYHLLVDKVFREVLGRDRLLVDQPTTWGLLAIETFSALLGARWGASNRERDAELPDRYPADWFAGRHLRREDARWLAGQAILREFGIAARLPTGETFRNSADALLRIPYSIAPNLILQTIHDAIGDGGHPWLLAEATRILTTRAVFETESTFASRRLLRRALPLDSITADDRLAMLEAVRRAETGDFFRSNELSDFEDWGVLSPDELQEVEAARASGRLFPPSDPREPATFVREGWSKSEGWQATFASRWPFSDDHSLLVRLQERESRQRDESLPPFEEDLGPRLHALQVILARPAALEAEWLGTVLGYCSHAIGDLLSWNRLQGGSESGDRTLQSEAATALYDAHAPWWRTVALEATARLRGPLPDDHASIKTELLHWGSGDPIYESLKFLDASLAVGKGEPFDEVRRDLESALSGVWDGWPGYTRATALAVLRPYHWATIPGLIGRIDHTLQSEDDPHVLHWCLQTLLQSSNAIADRLRGLIERIASLPRMAKLGHQAGLVIGDALIRARGDLEGWAELDSVADLGDLFMDRDDWHDEFRTSLAAGMLWGASNRLGQVSQPSDRHLEHWLRLARRSLGHQLLVREAEDQSRLQLQPVMLVLDKELPKRQRATLLLGLLDLFERIILEASIASFFDVHYRLYQQLKGEGSRPVLPIPDEALARLCHASSKRIADWAAKKKTTNDMGFSGTVYGRETADLIRLAFQRAADRDSMRRELAPCVDRLHESGRLDLATELRLSLRRG